VIAASFLAAVLPLLLAGRHFWRPSQISQCGYRYDASLRDHLSAFCPNPGLLSEIVQVLETEDMSLPGHDGEGGGVLSRSESFGFFEEPDDTWKLRKRIHGIEMGRQRRLARAFDQCQLAAAFWGSNYKPSFNCAFKQFVGGDEYSLGMYAVCDMHKIIKNAEAGKGCLVYSVGSDGDFSFEEAIRDKISAQCEVHTFDPNPVSFYNGENASPPDFVSYHAYPVGHDMGSRLESRGQESLGKSIPTIIRELGHEGRTIDLFKIDCEGCEFETYESLFGSDINIQQILIELHWNHCDRDMVRKVHKFFEHLQKHGYVAFHKEPNNVWNPEAPGANVEYSFIRLGSNFSAQL